MRNRKLLITLPVLMIASLVLSCSVALGVHFANASEKPSVTQAAPLRPVINTHPASRTVATDTPVTLSVNASGTSLTYQWYMGCVCNMQARTMITGATSSTITVDTSRVWNWYYYVVVTM